MQIHDKLYQREQILKSAVPCKKIQDSIDV